MNAFAWIAALGLAAAPVAAQTSAGGEPAAKAWRALAAADAEAAIALIADNHPGAHPSLGDTAFQARLAKARALVAERLPQVADHGGYNALLAGLAAGFGDGHIWSRSRVQTRTLTWPGIVLARQGGAWVVGVHKPLDGEMDVTGARLLSCDGVAADRWAADRIAQFYGDPAVEAQVATAAYQLLIDDGNPFLKRPATCTVQKNGEAPQAVALAWRADSRRSVEDAVVASLANGRAGMGVTPFDGGYWIGLETLSAEAGAVVEAVEAQADALRAAPMVVVDLRGNGGGNSAYAEAIATALAGEQRLDAVAVRSSGCMGAFWRASPGNIEGRNAFRAEASGRMSADALTGFDALTADMMAAGGEGRAFSPALPACASQAAVAKKPVDPARLPKSAMAGRLILVTDRACFSSCLIAADLFRRIGALHVGEATDVSTRYMEVREILLPSGLRTFSTLQKVAVGLGDYGPYQPHILYPGRLDDDAALKAWVADLR